MSGFTHKPLYGQVLQFKAHSDMTTIMISRHNISTLKSSHQHTHTNMYTLSISNIDLLEWSQATIKIQCIKEKKSYSKKRELSLRKEMRQS